VSIGREYLQDQVAAAKNIPAETNTVLRLNFCVWTQAVTRFFDIAQWQACAATVTDEELERAIACYGGLDLGQSDDLCAFAKVWLLEDGRIAVRMRYWLPRSRWRNTRTVPTTSGNGRACWK
jgi:phage terminase large subunit-like protein